VGKIPAAVQYAHWHLDAPTPFLRAKIIPGLRLTFAKNI
jgi:hypothetical protein